MRTLCIAEILTKECVTAKIEIAGTKHCFRLEVQRTSSKLKHMQICQIATLRGDQTRSKHTVSMTR